jgi:sugar/nucleoside kinase (ribokinase family)
MVTGAGDHFNAGFCLGRLLGGDLDANIHFGVATSGYYVREAASPTLAQLSGFVETLSQKQL